MAPPNRSRVGFLNECGRGRKKEPPGPDMTPPGGETLTRLLPVAAFPIDPLRKRKGVEKLTTSRKRLQGAEA